MSAASQQRPSARTGSRDPAKSGLKPTQGNRHSNVARPGRRKRAESRYVEQAERLAAQLRALREQHSMAQEQLAAQAQVSVATVRNIEKVVAVEPPLFTVLAMARVLGVSIEDVAA